jgi:hypothetical protein
MIALAVASSACLAYQSPTAPSPPPVPPPVVVVPPVVAPSAPPAPAVFLSCNTIGTAGEPTVCAVSGLHLQIVSIQWGDGSPEQSISPTVTTVAHVFPRADRYTVIVRGEDHVGQVAHASATAVIVNPPPPPPVVSPMPPPPVVSPPIVTATSVSMSQEAAAGAAGCAAFNVSATPATGRTITSIVVTHSAGSPGPWNFTGSGGRFVTCGLNDFTDILTATATDSSGDTATYQLFVR